MTDCNLIQLPSGKWWCPAPGCDDEKKRLLPDNLPRNCRSPKAGFSHRAQVERETAFFVDHGTATRTAEQIAATLDKCFGGCRYLKNNVCTVWAKTESPNCNARRTAWLKRLISKGCRKSKNSSRQ